MFASALLTILKMSMLLALALAAARGWSGTRLSPALRHWILLLGLVTSVVLAVVSIVAPVWHILPARIEAGASPHLALMTFEAITVPGPSDDASSSDWLLGVWVVGTLCCISHIALGCLILRRRRVVANRELSPEWRQTVTRLTPRGGHRSPVFLESERVLSPCTWGTIRPVILLPRRGAGWTSEARDAAVLHELAHIRRMDAAAHMLARAACALQWFNPLAWLVLRAAVAAREEAADDSALQAGAVPSAFAALLMELSVAQATAARSMSGALALRGHTDVGARIRRVLDLTTRRAPLPMRQRHLATLVALALVALVGPAAPALSSQTLLRPNPQAPRRATVQTVAQRDRALAMRAATAMCSRRRESGAGKPERADVAFTVARAGAEGGGSRDTVRFTVHASCGAVREGERR